MRNDNSILNSEDSVDLTPMIDIVFLLLIYFMVTTTLLKKESDIGIQLPSSVPASSDTPLPEEYIVDVLIDGTVLLNGAPMDAPGSRDMPTFVGTLERLKYAADRAELKMLIIINPDEDAAQQAIIDVLNACTKAKVTSVTFSGGGDA